MEKNDNTPVDLKEFAEKKTKEQLKRIGQDPDILVSFTWRNLIERLRAAKEQGTPANFFQLGYGYCQVIFLFRDYGEPRIKSVIGLEEFKRVFKEIEALSCFEVKK